jgi:REP element-mobilizing transposase RayT
MSRGCRRLELFRDGKDFNTFFKILRFALQASGCGLWAYTLMSNHYHLVLFGSSEALTACMRRVNHLYSLYHNKRYRLSGHAFDGPYRAYRLASDYLVVRTLAYVHFNPAAAGWKGPLEEYPWSSYGCYLGRKSSPLPVDVPSAMAAVHSSPQEAWKLFWRAMELEERRSARKGKSLRPMADVHSEQFEWLLENARDRREEFPGVRATMVAMHWGRQVGIAPRAMAKSLGERSAASVRQSLYELERRLKNNPELARRLPPPP